ncbi:MAG: adenylate kinase family protein [Candidatus Heimdallarchaeota archaeon]|nr:adenylate kinase family protein [Candidatus Heimdallarchaeota archaeon]
MTSHVIVLTGTPGTGKTSASQLVAQRGYFRLNLQEFAEIYDCFDGYDESRDSKILDGQKFQEQLTKFLEIGDGLIILEGHYGDLVPAQFVTKCFVLTTPIEELKTRLEKRKYSETKLEENLQAEIMQECWVDALDSFGSRKVTKIDNMPIEQIAELIITYSFVHLAKSDVGRSIELHR